MAEKGIILSRGTYDRLIAAASQMERDRGRRNIAGFDRRDESETSLPFLAVILAEGPEGHRYPYSDIRYWARQVRIEQKKPPHPPEDPHDQLARAVLIGEPFPLQNLMDLQRSNALDDVPPVNVTYNAGSVKALYPGHFVRVWSETDDEGWVRYFCSESPWQTCMAKPVSPASGDFAGVKGWYDGEWGYANPNINPTEPPATNTVWNDVLSDKGIMWSSTAADEGKIAIFNLAEVGDNGANQLHLPIGPLLAYPAGWTDEEKPRRILLVHHRSAPQVIMTAAGTAQASYGTVTQDLINALKDDLGAVITALRDAKLMK